MEHLDKTSPVSTTVTHRRILKGRRDDVSDVTDFCKVLGISPERICRELIRYSRDSLPSERRLPEDPAILGFLPVELLTQLEIPVLAFQETNVYDIYGVCSTGTRLVRNKASRNDWVWVQMGGEQMYGALWGRLPGKLRARFKISDYTHENMVRRLAYVQMLNAVNLGRLSDVQGLATVQLREDTREFTIVDTEKIRGLAHLIPATDRPWLVNSHVDLWTFNEIY